MPKLIAAFTAGEFLDEAIESGDITTEGIEKYNENSMYPYEWWTLD